MTVIIKSGNSDDSSQVFAGLAEGLLDSKSDLEEAFIATGEAIAASKRQVTLDDVAQLIEKAMDARRGER